MNLGGTRFALSDSHAEDEDRLLSCVAVDCGGLLCGLWCGGGSFPHSPSRNDLLPAHTVLNCSHCPEHPRGRDVQENITASGMFSSTGDAGGGYVEKGIRMFGTRFVFVRQTTE